MIQWFLFALFLSACSQSIHSVSTPLSSKENDARPQHNEAFRKREFQRHRSMIPSSSVDELSAYDLSYDVESYRLKGSFDWGRKVMTGEVNIRFKMANPDAVTVEIDSQVHRVLAVTSAQGVLLSYTWSPQQKLQVDLSPFTREERRAALGVVIRYEVLADSLAAGDRVGLNSVSARSGDPLTGRVIFTHSEPLAASTWMPCHDVPSDRATFAIEYVVAPQEMLIANGTLTKNELDSVQGTRTIGYSTSFTLPTYVMAFAVGEFEVLTRQLGTLPISLVTRRGLKLDHRSMLDMLVEQMTRFQELLGPYPYESYSLVLLPEFGGGMEHVGITFQDEIGSASGKLSPDYWLSAHEMAHQWFGDWMTVREWDDLWIKEGMATLMAEEASRGREDSKASGRLFGRNFQPDSGDAIRDPSLSPDEKYTTGPYDRSAWFFTQVRHTLGEARFWATWRKLLKEFALGAIGTEDVVKAFSSEVGPVIAAKLSGAIAAKELPKLVVERMDDGKIKLALSDPDGALIIPLEVRVYASATQYRTLVLDSQKPVFVAPAETHFVVVDPRDAQAMVKIWDLQFDDGERRGRSDETAKIFWPKELAEIDALAEVGPHAMVQSLEVGFPRLLSPQVFASLYGRVGSQETQYRLLQTACEMAGAGAVQEVEWTEAILSALRNTPYFGLHSDFNGRGLSQCRLPVIRERLAARLRDLSSSSPIEEVLLLSKWLREPTLAFQVWGGLGRESSNVSLRMIAVDTLTKFLLTSPALQPLEGEKPQWREYLMSYLGQSDVTKVVGSILNWVKKSKDTSEDVVTAFGNLMRRDSPWKAKLKAMCIAHELGKDDATFVERIQQKLPADLPVLFSEALVSGGGC